MKILLVDDSLSILTLLRDYLKQYGSCDFAINGKMAVELFTSEMKKGDPYDLVLLDVLMPVMDGQRALIKMRTVEKALGKGDVANTPIVMLTSLDSSLQVMDAYFSGGCTGYIIKPVTKQGLLDRLMPICVQMATRPPSDQNVTF